MRPDGTGELAAARGAAAALDLAAHQGAGNGNHITMHAVAWAVFHIVGDGSGNPKYRGYYRATLTYASGGITTTEQVTTSSQVRVVRLIS